MENLKLIDYKKRLDDMYIIMYAIKNEIKLFFYKILIKILEKNIKS